MPDPTTGNNKPFCVLVAVTQRPFTFTSPFMVNGNVKYAVTFAGMSTFITKSFWFLIDMSKLKNVQENYTFQLGFDNYLEYVEIIINYNYYDKRKIDNIFEIL